MTEDNKKYRICWKSEATGATGGGTTTFPREQAQAIADSENKFYMPLKINHWIEPVDEARDAQG